MASVIHTALDGNKILLARNFIEWRTTRRKLESKQSRETKRITLSSSVSEFNTAPVTEQQVFAGQLSFVSLMPLHPLCLENLPG